MSETTTDPTASNACDSLLDYVYGELSGDALEAFKLHLLTCEKCKRELAGLERVRSAVKLAMPVVEPPVEKMSAIQAQLMQAAAQRKPKRGKILTFARRMVSHPAYAAAAAVVIVGGAVAYNFSAGRVMMPEKSAPVAAAPVTTPTVETGGPVGAAAPAQPAAPAALPAADTVAPAHAAARAVEKFANEEKPIDSKIVLKSDAPSSSEYTVRRGAAKKQSAPNDDELDGAFYKNKDKDSVNDRKRDQNDGLLGGDIGGGKGGGYATKGHAAPGAGELARANSYGSNVIPQSGRVDSNAGAAASAPVAQPVAKVAAAPPPPPKPKMAETRSESPPAQMAQAQAPNEPAPAPTTALAESQQKREPKREATREATREKEKSATDLPQLKKQAEKLALASRCEEAVPLYQQIDQLSPRYLSVSERAPFVRCLRSTGRVQEADAEDARIQQESVSATRASKRPAPAKASKPSSPASSAPADAAKAAE